MDALIARCAILAAAVASLGASYRTPNFVVEAPTPQIAEQIGRAAETYRRDLAIEWLGSEMRNWSQPCPITAQVADHLGAGGATSFVFEHGEVFGWRMTIQGSLVRILDSVLPHEVTHTIFATHFRQPLPRWADEGACTTVEHASERAKQHQMLYSFLRTKRGIPFSQMFAMREYPHDVMPLYSQGYSVARYLIAQGGKRKFLEFLADGLRDDNWPRATKQSYDFDNLRVLQDNWLAWVKQGSPELAAPAETLALVAVNTPAPAPEAGRRARPAANLLYRDRAARSSSPASREGNASVYELASNRPGPRAGEVDAAAGETDDAWRPRVSKVRGTSRALAAAPAPSDSPAELPGPLPLYQATRPQAIGRPQQVILEWSRPTGDATPGALPGPG
jgi:hypothetical protein